MILGSGGGGAWEVRRKRMSESAEVGCRGEQVGNTRSQTLWYVRLRGGMIGAREERASESRVGYASRQDGIG